MEILWPALGICAIVVFAFAILAQHWQRLLRQHSWTIRRLMDRVRDLEEVGDPEFRRRIVQFSPSPLEHVFIFSLRLDDHFWRKTLRASAEDLNFIRTFGSFLGSVKIERWRGHSVVTVTEVLPDSKSAGWQTRTLDFYAEDLTGGKVFTLWELPLARPKTPSDNLQSLELLLRQNSLELVGHLSAPAREREYINDPLGSGLSIFRVPLDSHQLAEFRSLDPMPSAQPAPCNGNSWQDFYSFQDDRLGFEWQLWHRDLEQKAEWDQWKVLETAPLRTGTE